MTAPRANPTAQHDVTDLVSAVVDRAIRQGATDVHFEPRDEGLSVRLRVDGQLVDVDMIPPAIAVNVIGRLKVIASLLTYRTDIPQEGGVRWSLSDSGTGPTEGAPSGAGAARPSSRTAMSTGSSDVVVNETSWDLRVATFPTIRGERAVVRIFRQASASASPADLGFDETQVHLLRWAVEQPAGMIVVAGPAGSGKTTTLYSLIEHLRDRFPQRSVITLEDPVERRVNGVTQIQINPYGELDYERCLRSLLRQDPQVLLVGEVRDARTAEIVIQAALTGHLILTTLHSLDPGSCVVRFLEMGIAPYQLASTLSLACVQRLVRLICAACRGGGRTPGEKGAADAVCTTCLGTGYYGRTAIGQVCLIDDEVHAHILTSPVAADLRAMFAARGTNLWDRGRALAQAGRTTPDELRRVLGDEPPQ